MMARHNDATASITIEGELAINAHAAQAQIKDGHFVPALCLELVPHLGGQRFKAEVHYPAGQDLQCELDAKALHKGLHVTFTVNTANLFYKAIDVQGLQVIATPAPAAPATPTDPDLFAAEQAAA